MLTFSKLYPNIRLGLMSLCLALSLTSCASQFPRPDSKYLQDTPVTYLTVAAPTNKDIVSVAVARQGDTESCNADKAALRAWFDSHVPVPWYKRLWGKL